MSNQHNYICTYCHASFATTGVFLTTLKTRLSKERDGIPVRGGVWLEVICGIPVKIISFGDHRLYGTLTEPLILDLVTPLCKM